MSNQENNNIPTQIPQLPPIPILTLPPPQIKDTSYAYHFKRKHLMDINGEQQYSNSKQQVQKKLTEVTKKAQQNSHQLQSTGQAIKINQQLYTLCHRCNKKVLKNQFDIHLSCHAAIILQNLLLGDKFCAQSNKQLIQRMKVTHVVNAAAQLPNYLQKNGLKYLQLDLYDTLDQQLQAEMEKAAQFIKQVHNNGGIVFVHCAVGKSRSVSVILTYLLKQKGMSITQGLKFVKQKRPIAQPNFSYMKQLLQYQQKFLKQKQQKQQTKQKNETQKIIQKQQKQEKQQNQLIVPSSC